MFCLGRAAVPTTACARVFRGDVLPGDCGDAHSSARRQSPSICMKRVIPSSVLTLQRLSEWSTVTILANWLPHSLRPSGSTLATMRWRRSPGSNRASVLKNARATPPPTPLGDSRGLALPSGPSSRGVEAHSANCAETSCTHETAARPNSRAQVVGLPSASSGPSAAALRPSTAAAHAVPGTGSRPPPRSATSAGSRRQVRPVPFREGLREPRPSSSWEIRAARPCGQLDPGLAPPSASCFHGRATALRLLLKPVAAAPSLCVEASLTGPELPESERYDCSSVAHAFKGQPSSSVIREPPVSPLVWTAYLEELDATSPPKPTSCRQPIASSAPRRASSARAGTRAPCCPRASPARRR
mmetsp:Transcript_102818/g.286280  ORF Transcript_102818/g.286280 Transcript_102818/m.286280 type:complete len:357 (+) Transcript_102818:222-1292(+)